MLIVRELELNGSASRAWVSRAVHEEVLHERGLSETASATVVHVIIMAARGWPARASHGCHRLSEGAFHVWWHCSKREKVETPLCSKCLWTDCLTG